MTPHVTSHAVSRYRLRVAPVSEAEAREALRCPAVQAAAAIGARYVRLATGQRIVIENGAVVTVLPADHHKRQVGRRNVGAKFARALRKPEREGMR